MQIHPQAHRINSVFDSNAVQAYILIGDKVALVDTGVAHTPEQDIEPYLRQLGLSLGDVDLIINTHGHPDHLGGNSEVKAASAKAQMAIHRDDVNLAGGPEVHLASPHDITMLLRLAGKDDALKGREVAVRRFVRTSVGVDRILEEGDVVELGKGATLQVLHTPGHTPGSVSLYWEKERFLIVGDAVQCRGTRPGVLPLYFYGAAYLQSLRKLSEIQVETLCLGHAFQWSKPDPDPVRRGPDALQTIRESLEVAQAIDQTVREVSTNNPEASLLEIGKAILLHLSSQLPIQFEADGSVPALSLAPIHAHLTDVKGGSPTSP